MGRRPVPQYRPGLRTEHYEAFDVGVSALMTLPRRSCCAPCRGVSAEGTASLRPCLTFADPFIRRPSCPRQDMVRVEEGVAPRGAALLNALDCHQARQGSSRPPLGRRHALQAARLRGASAPSRRRARNSPHPPVVVLTCCELTRLEDPVHLSLVHGRWHDRGLT